MAPVCTVRPGTCTLVQVKPPLKLMYAHPLASLGPVESQHTR